MLSLITGTILSNTDIDNHRTTIKGYFQHQLNPGYPQTPNDVGHYAVPINTSGAVSILSYGATPNDTSAASQNVDALQNAINSNAKVYIPQGVFYLLGTARIKFPSNIKLIYGSGTLKTLENSATPAYFKGYENSPLSNFIMDGLTLEDVCINADTMPMNNVIFQNLTFKTSQAIAKNMKTAKVNFVARPKVQIHHLYMFNNTFYNSPRGSIELLWRDFDIQESRHSTELTDVQIKGNISLFTNGNFRNTRLNCFVSLSDWVNTTIEDNYAEGEWWGVENENWGSLIIRNNNFKNAMPIAGRYHSVDTLIEGNNLECTPPILYHREFSIWSGGFVDGIIRNNKMKGDIELYHPSGNPWPGSVIIENNEITAGSTTYSKEVFYLHDGIANIIINDNLIMTNNDTITMCIHADGLHNGTAHNNTYAIPKLEYPFVRNVNGSNILDQGQKILT